MGIWSWGERSGLEVLTEYQKGGADSWGAGAGDGEGEGRGRAGEGDISQKTMQKKKMKVH